MRRRIERHCGNECGWEWRGGARLSPEHSVSVILDQLFPIAVAGIAHAALKREIEDGFDATRDVTGEQRDGARRRDRRQAAIADAMSCDEIAHIIGQTRDVGGGEERGCVVERECALFSRDLGTRRIGTRRDGTHPTLGQRDGSRRVITLPAHRQRVTKAGDAETDAPLCFRLPSLRLERVV